jgi:hypothetical protein
MMRVMFLTLVVTLAIGPGAAGAQDSGELGSKIQSITGVVKAVSTSSLTVETGGNAIMFALGSWTRVLARGTQPRDLVLRKRRPGFTDFVKPGDQVTVRYRPSGDVLKAVEVRISNKTTKC